MELALGGFDADEEHILFDMLTLDRLVHNAHRIEMRGDSMRKSRGKAGG